MPEELLPKTRLQMPEHNDGGQAQTDLPLPEMEIPAHSGTDVGGNGRKLPLPKYIFLGVVFLILLVLISGAYLLGQNQSSQTETPAPSVKACTQEAKVCPDGSAVGREGPNCEFTLCPSPTPSSSAETADWKTYTNTQFSFSFKYPTDWKTEQAYDPTGSPNLKLNLGLTPLSKDKGEYSSPITVMQYDNPNNLTFQEWDKKMNEQKPVTKYFNQKDTKPANISGLTAYVNDKGVCHPVYCKEIIIMGNKNVFVFTVRDFTDFEYTQEELDTYNETLDQILPTFKLN